MIPQLAFIWMIGLVAGARIVQADIPGACCFPDGSCDVYVNSVDCVDDGGVFAGVGVTCDNASCPTTSPACDIPLEFSTCPTRILFETSDVDGIEFDLPNIPTARGCDVIVTLEPPLGAWLPVGETPIVAIAEDAYGESLTCGFLVVVDWVGETGPIRKRRIKGGGAQTDVDGVTCDNVGLLAGKTLCGVCPLSGYLGAFASMAVSRRRRSKCRRSRSRAD